MHMYDRDGSPISVEEWSRLHNDRQYIRIGETTIGNYVVSTVWLGIDHSWDKGRPVIFETMVFTSSAWTADRSDPDRDPLLELDCVRYSTEREARKGHRDMCTLVRATTQEVPSEAPSEPQK